VLFLIKVGGARAMGLEEKNHLAWEMGDLVFPHDYPHTLAGKKEGEREAKEAAALYQLRPPGKRPNYSKLFINSPFLIPWDSLWSTESVHFPTTKKKKKKGKKVSKPQEEEISSALSTTLYCAGHYEFKYFVTCSLTLTPAKTRTSPTTTTTTTSRKEEEQLRRYQISPSSGPTNNKHALAPVWVYMTMKGTYIRDRARIYQQPLQQGKQVKERIQCQSAEAKNLVPLGFVTSGGYSYMQGLCKGFGYCDALLVSLMLERKEEGSKKRGRERQVLVRNENSQWYHIAFLTVHKDGS